MASNASDPQMNDDGEDDYLSMTFEDKPTKSKESSLQRTTRLKKESAERGRMPSKAELAQRERTAREQALATEIDSSNKGAQMLAKMGYKGSALGQVDHARTQPITLSTKDDRGGIGMDSERKRKIREAAAAIEAEANVAKKQKVVDENEFRARNRAEREEKRAEGQMWATMKVLEGYETGVLQTQDEAAADQKSGSNREDLPSKTEGNTLRNVNSLYRPLIKRRFEREREQRMKIELNNSLSTRNDDDYDDCAHDAREEYHLDETGEELEAFESLSFAERRDRVISELRSRYYYCFWCKHQYEDERMEGCPGLSEDEHG